MNRSISEQGRGLLRIVLTRFLKLAFEWNVDRRPNGEGWSIFALISTVCGISFCFSATFGAEDDSIEMPRPKRSRRGLVRKGQ